MMKPFAVHLSEIKMEETRYNKKIEPSSRLCGRAAAIEACTFDHTYYKKSFRSLRRIAVLLRLGRRAASDKEKKHKG